MMNKEDLLPTRQEGILFTIDCLNSHKYNFDYNLEELIKETKQLQSNWNSLREWLENKIDNFQDDVSEPILHEQMTMRVIYEYMENLDKMNELEGKDEEWKSF